MNAMVKLMPGLKPLKLDFEITSDLSRGSNNSYSLAETLAWPGPVEKCAIIIASTFYPLISECEWLQGFVLLIQVNRILMEWGKLFPGRLQIALELGTRYTVKLEPVTLVFWSRD